MFIVIVLAIRLSVLLILLLADVCYCCKADGSLDQHGIVLVLSGLPASIRVFVNVCTTQRHGPVVTITRRAPRASLILDHNLDSKSMLKKGVLGSRSDFCHFFTYALGQGNILGYLGLSF